MKKTSLYTITLSLLLATVFAANSSVYINENQKGEVLLFPFYTVVNGLNTLISINNTQGDKAIKVTIRESKESARLLSFNLFLKSNDTWTGALTEQAGKVFLLTSDKSCTSLGHTLPLTQELLTFELDPDELLTIQERLERMEIGSIEVFEMGSVVENDNFLHEGIRDNACEFLLEQYAIGGQWGDDLNNGTVFAPVSGGLHGSATVIDVENGFSFDTPVLHFDNFYPEGTVFHTRPEDGLPDLSSGDTTSLIIDAGRVYETRWPTGYEAISALLMKSTVENEFDVSSEIAAVTEWIYSFPTLRFYINNDVHVGSFVFAENDSTAFRFPYPYGIYPNSIGVGGDGGQSDSMHDREGFSMNPYIGCGIICPPATRLYLSSSLIIQSFVNTTDEEWWKGHSLLGGSYSKGNIFVSNFNAFELDDSRYFTGKMQLRLAEGNYSAPTLRGVDVHTNQPVEYQGLPVTGFAFYRYVNANAQPGLLANYATTKPHYGDHSIKETND
ncbi:MAG: hypothetical protein KDI92_06505 [Xanthomonadales bacterium]|nr:hypothetical protein [Xanthomonadales bacterium]